jgi:hypothetical protein
MTETIAPAAGSTVKEQASALLAHAAGYASHRTIAMGLRSGLLEELGRGHPDELAERLDLDPFYVSVWCRSALSAGVRDRDGDRYRFAPPRGHPAAGPGLAGVRRRGLQRPGAAGDVRPLRGQPGLGGAAVVGRVQPRLDRGRGRDRHPVLHPAGPGSACGAGVGLVRLAQHFPACRVVGVDGDAHSIERATARVAEAGPAGCSWSAARSRTSRSTSRRPWSSTTSPCTSAATSTWSPGTCATPSSPRLVRDLRLPLPRHRRGPAQRPWPDHGRHPVSSRPRSTTSSCPAPTTTASSPATSSPTWARPASRRCAP